MITKNKLQNLKNKGLTNKKIAEYFSVSERTISRKLNGYGLTNKTNRDDIKDVDVITMYNDGYSQNEIAKSFNCSIDTISKRLSKYNLSNTRAEGIKRHFNKTYEDRWPEIKKDLDAGLAKSIVREKHHIRMDNLENLMLEHNYGVVNKKYDVVDDLKNEINDFENKKVTVSNTTRLKYMNLIKEYIDVYNKLPSVGELAYINNYKSMSVYAAIKRYNLWKYINKRRISCYVAKLLNDLDNYNIEYEINNRNILLKDNGFYDEVDIYLPKLRLGIEVNPVSTHSYDSDIGIGKDKSYHQRKSLLAESKNIGLLQLYDKDFVDECAYQKILQYLIIDNKLMIGARKCAVRDITLYDCNIFLDQYHFQGSIQGVDVCLGLFHDDDLVSVLVVGKSRFAQADYEILRYCVRPDIGAIGGFNKLFKHFIKKCDKDDRIISYMDLDKRLIVENVYEKSGFKLDKISDPSYWWTNKYGDNTILRYDTMKSKLIKLGYDKNKTEVEIMKDRGFFRVFGAGSKRYSYTV